MYFISNRNNSKCLLSNSKKDTKIYINENFRLFCPLGPTLPYLLQYSAMAKSPDGKGVLLFGGSSNGNYENRILELRAGANSWNFLDITLENGRYKHSVIPLQ